MSIRKLNVTEASISGLFVTIIGQIVAYVPSLGPEQAHLISLGSFIIGAVFALAHAVSDGVAVLADARAGKVKVTLSDLEDGIRQFADDEISKIKNVNPADVAKIAQEVVDGKVHVPSVGDIEKIAEAKLEQLLSGGVSLKVAPPLAVAAAPAPEPIPQPVPPPVS